MCECENPASVIRISSGLFSLYFGHHPTKTASQPRYFSPQPAQKQGLHHTITNSAPPGRSPSHASVSIESTSISPPLPSAVNSHDSQIPTPTCTPQPLVSEFLIGIKRTRNPKLRLVNCPLRCAHVFPGYAMP